MHGWKINTGIMKLFRNSYPIRLVKITFKHDGRNGAYVSIQLKKSYSGGKFT